MQKLVFAILALVLVANGAFASDWAGQSVVTPLLPPQYGFVRLWGGSTGTYTQYVPTCMTNYTSGNPPPCTPTQHKVYNRIVQSVSTIPSAAVGPNSGVMVDAHGYFPDPSNPLGYSSFNAGIPLNDFATTSSVVALQSLLDSEMVRANTFVKHYAAQGVAQAIAMAGVGEIDPDQKISLAVNFGSYEGQSAAAVGLAIRMNRHVSFSGGMSGMGSGTYGVHAGFRIGW